MSGFGDDTRICACVVPFVGCGAVSSTYVPSFSFLPYGIPRGMEEGWEEGDGTWKFGIR